MRNGLLLLLAITAGTISGWAQTPDAFSYAIAYRTNIGKGEGFEGGDIYYNRRINRDIRLPGDTLRGPRLNQIWTLLTDTNTFKGGTAACFSPRHALVFYDNRDRIILQIDICFQCNYMTATDWQQNYSRELGSEIIGQVYDLQSLTGFSRTGYFKLKDFFCGSLRMDACPKRWAWDFLEEGGE